MSTKWIALAAIASLTQVSGLLAQADSAAVAPEEQDSDRVVVMTERSPLAAGMMSAVLPGLGSFYAGNSGHGVTHLAVAAASFAGMLAGNDSCQIVFAGPDSNCTLIAVSGLVFIGNWIWSMATAAGDAKEYNRSLYVAGLQVEPRLVAVRSGSQTGVGLQILRYGF